MQWTRIKLRTHRYGQLRVNRTNSDSKFKVARYNNAHKYLKQRTPNLTFFAQIGLAIMFTTNSRVKHRILHVLRDVYAIWHVKTGEMNADVLIADVIRKCNF